MTAADVVNVLEGVREIARELDRSEQIEQETREQILERLQKLEAELSRRERGE